MILQKIAKLTSFVYPTQLIKFTRNISEYLLGFMKIKSLKLKEGWTRLGYTALYVFDIGPSVLTGGAPWESFSSRFQKDRHTFVAKVVLGFIEFFDKGHGLKVLDAYHGEGSVYTNNKELSSGFQAALGVFWAAIIGLTVAGQWSIIGNIFKAVFLFI